MQIQKNADYEVSDMGEYLSVFTGSLEQVFILKESEIEIFNLFDIAISIEDAVSILTDLYAESEADRINIKNDCANFIINLIENRVLIEDSNE